MGDGDARLLEGERDPVPQDPVAGELADAGRVEREPNSEAATAEPVTLPVTLLGHSDDDDADLYVLDNVNPSDTLALSVQILDEPRTANVRVLDGNGAVVWDASNSWLDESVSLAGAALPIYVEVRSLLTDANERNLYQLSLGLE